MGKDGEHTGFEWLDRPFMLTRIWVTLVATFFLTLFAYRIIYMLMFVRLGPPPPPVRSEGPEEAETVRTPCGGERRPWSELGSLAMVSNLTASSMILVWRRPRMGFLVAAFFGLPIWAPLGLWPAIWLCFAAWKVGRPTSSPAAGASLP